MPSNCFCNIAAEFPISEDLGIISASLKTNVEVSVTSEGLVMTGPVSGNLSISAYAPLAGDEVLACPGQAGVSYNWQRRISCEVDEGVGRIVTRLVPTGVGKSFREGDVTELITMEQISEYETFNASASSGPHTVYLKSLHNDGYDFVYTGVPLTVGPDDGQEEKEVDFLTAILPTNSRLYLNSFNWSYTPPNIPTVSYSFIFIYDA